MGCYQYFSHEIDTESHFCVGCGRFLAELQGNHRWDGNKVSPACYNVSNVSAISHLVRRPQDRS